MELVGGIKITDYCDHNQLTTRQRLDLFIQVCRAVQHAHQKGIIHRDIKPSNILVATQDGVAVPKVIDFGIAKATQGRLTDQTLFTAFEQFLGTPAYMSPEQAQLGGLDVDTRSDIYSLGVLLYELLTGTTPFDTKELVAAGLDEMRRTIREVEPVKPSTRLTQERSSKSETRNTRPEIKSALRILRSEIDRDLDWIVMKCLEKDRARCYETANGLARDIARHLNNEPVIARPPSKFYEFRKTVRRHKFGFAATAAVIVALSIGATLSTWQAVRATRAEREQSRLRGEAEAAKQEIREGLRAARPNEARALRVSGQPGRRFQSLVALSNAAAIRPSVELRNEAIAALTQVDIQLARMWQIPLGKEQWWWDDALETFTVSEPSGNLRVRSAFDNHELARIQAPDGAAGAPGVFSRNRRFAVVGYPQGRVHVWDVSRSAWSLSVTGSWAALSPDNKTLAVVAPDGGVGFYDLATSTR